MVSIASQGTIKSTELVDRIPKVTDSSQLVVEKVASFSVNANGKV